MEPVPPPDDFRPAARRIAHDLNNTIGTIVGNLELLRMDIPADHPGTESVVELRKATDRVKLLVEQLFNMTGPPPASGSAIHPTGGAADAAAASVPASSKPLPRGQGQHILYLDDEEPLVFLATNLFKRLGYRVSGFTDARTACDAFLANPTHYDIIVTDHNLKNDSGVEVATRLLSIRPDIPIVLASGALTDGLADDARRAGIRHVVYKPNTVDALCNSIHQLVSPPPTA